MKTAITKRPALLVAILLAGASIAQARDVRVNSVEGIYTAIASAAPGDTILIKPGKYNMDKEALSMGHAGTADKPITLRAEGDSGYATLNVTAKNVVSFRVGGSYWIFRGLDVRGNSSTFDVIQIAGQGVAKHVTFVDCKASGGQQSAIKAASGDGNVFTHMADDCLIDHCEFYNVGETALDLDGGKNWVVRGNYVHDYGKSSGPHYGIFMKGGTRDGLIEGNFVDGKSRGGQNVGISFGGGRMGKTWLPKLPNGQWAPEMENGLCRNNIVVNAGAAGYHSNDSHGCKYFNNLAYHCGSGFQRQHGYAPGPALVNNVLSGNIAGAGVVRNNLTAVRSNWFVKPDEGNFTLTPAGQAALAGSAMSLKENPVDYFGQPRKGAMQTLGPVNADETRSTKWVDARVTGKPTILPQNHE